MTDTQTPNDDWTLDHIIKLTALVATLAALVWALTACVVGPDGRRALHPAVGAALSDVLACGAPLAAGALKGSPDYAAAASCHLERVGRRIGVPVEHRDADLERGRKVIEAAVAQDLGDDRKAKAIALECESLAREELAGE